MTLAQVVDSLKAVAKSVGSLLQSLTGAGRAGKKLSSSPVGSAVQACPLTQSDLLPKTTSQKPLPVSPENNSRQERERWAKDMAAYIDDWKNRSPNSGAAKCLEGRTLAAQLAEENSWGLNAFAQRTSNWGNIKGTGPGGSEKRSVPEYKNGEKYYVDADFRKYNNLDEFLEDYASLIRRQYPDACGKIGEDYYKELKKGGYATDPDYVTNITRIYNQI